MRTVMCVDAGFFEETHVTIFTLSGGAVSKIRFATLPRCDEFSETVDRIRELAGRHSVHPSDIHVPDMPAYEHAVRS